MMTLKQEIRNAFNRCATEYEEAAKVQSEIGDRLFERLDLLKITPRYVLDLGCGPGGFSERLKAYYPDAQIIGLDLAMDMLLVAKEKHLQCSLVNADMMALPFESGVFDLIFANQVIHWAPNLPRILRELHRVMNVQGCLMFSTLGPDTFQELRQAFQAVDHFAHTNDFADMHDVGDCLLKASFVEPVMDMQRLTAHYKNTADLLHSLKSQGVRNVHTNRNRGLTSKQAWSKLETAMSEFKTPEQKLPLTYEVVYGHAWKGFQNGQETRIPVKMLKQRCST
jgi:malonyl-CoA O-methyltransferase